MTARLLEEFLLARTIPVGSLYGTRALTVTCVSASARAARARMSGCGTRWPDLGVRWARKGGRAEASLVDGVAAEDAEEERDRGQLRCAPGVRTATSPDGQEDLG